MCRRLGTFSFAWHLLLLKHQNFPNLSCWTGQYLSLQFATWWHLQSFLIPRTMSLPQALHTWVAATQYNPWNLLTKQRSCCFSSANVLPTLYLLCEHSSSNLAVTLRNSGLLRPTDSGPAEHGYKNISKDFKLAVSSDCNVIKKWK